MISRNWHQSVAVVASPLALLLLVSFVTWALGIAFTARLANWQVYDDLRYTTPSTAEIYFYSCAVPMAVALAAAVDLGLFLCRLLYPVVSIVWSIVALGLWSYMFTIWGVCEYSPDMGGSSCPKFYVYDGYPESVYGSGLWIGRLVLGVVAALLALVQMSIAARAVDLERKQQKKARAKGGPRDHSLDQA